MKAYTKEETRLANKMAMQYLYSINNILLNKRFRYDARTRVGNLAASIVRAKQLSESEKMQIKALKRKRANARSQNNQVPILRQPIVVDWIKNKRWLKVQNNRLTDGYRNHWAKNEKDLKILAVLRKYA